MSLVPCNYCSAGIDDVGNLCIFCDGHGIQEREEYDSTCETCGEEDCDCPIPAGGSAASPAPGVET